jgi:branched-chain amino acid transport system substrate-binding protein
MGKRRAAVVDDQTTYGTGLTSNFIKGFEAAGGTVVAHQGVKVGDTEFGPLLDGLPKDYDVLVFGGIKEGALILKAMRARGNNTLFACGDGCWDVKNFIVPSEGAALKGEGVRVLSAAPSIGKVPGSADFAAHYTKAYGPINNYAANSYDAARVVIAAIERAASAKKAVPSRAEVLAAMRQGSFQGIAYAAPVTWSDKGDSTAAVIFVNTVEGDHFKEIDEIRAPS